MQKVLFYISKVLIKKVLSSFAKSIQSFRPPEPYKGKGVLFNNEIIRRKEGKKK